MLAIKFYKDMPSDNEDVLNGVDGKIPALVVDLDVTPNYPIDETFEQMTDEQYLEYMNSIQSELDEWKTIQEN